MSTNGAADENPLESVDVNRARTLLGDSGVGYELAKLLSDAGAGRRSTRKATTPQPPSLYVKSYAYGQDIVRNNQIVPVQSTAQSATLFPPDNRSGGWLGYVLDGHVTITQSRGLENRQVSDAVWTDPTGLLDLQPQGKGKVKLDGVCLARYRTTILRVLTKGEMFFLWETATRFACTRFTYLQSNPTSYLYVLTAGRGPLVLACPLGTVKNRGENLEDILGWQLLRYASLPLSRLIEVSTLPSTTVLWVPLTLIEGRPDLAPDVFVFAHAWIQALAARDQAIREAQLLDAITNKSPKELGVYATGPLCFLDDALAGRVPLYRFIDEQASDDFAAFAAAIRGNLFSNQSATRKQARNNTPASPLLAPYIVGGSSTGGFFSLSMRMSSGPVPPGYFDQWNSIFKAIKTAETWITGTYPPPDEPFRVLLPNLAKWYRGAEGSMNTSKSSQMVFSTCGKISKKGTPRGPYAYTNCPFFDAYIELTQK